MQKYHFVLTYLNTADKPLWDEFMTLAHLNELAISQGVFVDPLQAMMVAQLFKVIKKLGWDFSEWEQKGLEPGTAPES